MSSPGRAALQALRARSNAQKPGMADTIRVMKTRPRVTIRQASPAELQAEIAVLETKYPGLTSGNVRRFFNGPDGIIPGDVLVDAMRADQLYDVLRDSSPAE